MTKILDPDLETVAKESTFERLKESCLMIIFGASGDLTKRLLIPALYNLECEGLLPEKFAILGTAKSDFTTETFQAKLSEDILEFGTREFDSKKWKNFVNRIHYVPCDIDDSSSYEAIGKLIKKLDDKYALQGNHLFYFAVSQLLFATISQHLFQAGLISRTEGWTRVILEKPFGNDLESALALNKSIHKYWHEDQVWRIDHYLGKETVQNILAFRFANGIFEPLWNRNYIDHIQFTSAEEVGVEGRISYYDKAGVVRDMMQNHMFQVLSYIAMEPPRSFNADAIRNSKLEVLKAIHRFEPEDVLTRTARGQYGPGQEHGKDVCGYREEAGIPPDSRAETFAALKLYIDNWRWQGVPIYLRSGKRLEKRATQITIQFKRAPHAIFRDTSVEKTRANRLIFNIQPNRGIEMIFEAKVPGPKMQLQPVHMNFEYQDAFDLANGTGYETLLHDCLTNDATLFPSSDLVETSWDIVQPILDVWGSLPPRGFPNYAAGSWGPDEAEKLMTNDGRRWKNP